MSLAIKNGLNSCSLTKMKRLRVISGLRLQIRGLVCGVDYKKCGEVRLPRK